MNPTRLRIISLRARAWRTKLARELALIDCQRRRRRAWVATRRRGGAR